MLINEDGSGHEKDVAYVGGLIKRVSNFDPERFEHQIDERIKFQKTVYLIQAFDIDLGYDYNWYLHGPYCPSLADVGYSIANQYEDIYEIEFEDEYYEDQFSEFLEFINPIKNDTERLEIAASLHYLWRKNRNKQRDILIQWLLDEKDLDLDQEDEQDDFDVADGLWRRLSGFEVIDE